MNTKNPMALWIARMASNIQGGRGTLSVLMEKFFSLNYGKTTLPKTVADFIIYDQQPMVAGQTSLFKGTFSVTRSNWPNGNNFVAPESEHMVIQSLRFWEADLSNATPLDEADWQPGINDAVAKNATIDIVVNGQKVITQLPLTAFLSNYLDTNIQGQTNSDVGRFYLAEPIVVLGQTSINVLINLNPGKTPATDYGIRCELEGQRFIGN
jgi:hypothetical protein